MMRSYVRLWDAGRMQGDELALQFLHRCVLDGRLFNDGRDIISSLRPKFQRLIASLQGWRHYQEWRDAVEGEPEALTLPLEGDDFVWADEQNAVVVFKHGDRHAYFNFMFRNRAVNNLARVHFTTPEIDRLATMRMAARINDVGEEVVRPPTAQWHHMQVRRSRWDIIPGLESYWAGEMLSTNARRPSPLADFYEGRYGDYYIAMNTTDSNDFKLNLGEYLEPDQLGVNLVTGECDRFEPERTYRLGPRKTMVLYLGK